ncbi:fam-c protein [Plasmodium vinckei lentum]|uniref:Fam-c protein n=1 Tax=Plasmodium vinckei lentum TaxID=138297 RepID=A0A6V7SKQ2_PLAVN|nr:fam-c protein [Plasmodium vinckei lentum]
MNRRIFSLVCIALYALLDASIYCSQQKETGARNKNVRDTKEINRNNDEDDKESGGFNIFKRGKKSKRTKAYLHNEISERSSIINEFINSIPPEFQKTVHETIANNCSKYKMDQKNKGTEAYSCIEMLSPQSHDEISDISSIINIFINSMPPEFQKKTQEIITSNPKLFNDLLGYRQTGQLFLNYKPSE